ncbi:hypothetical protein QCA50_001485 [Cerrena zonata]|uniref:Uncharacterized protein n=1 Tax=Cerrena zonata TaxID=2478898 RepID=A0AAW0GL40_9APHY
MLDNPPAPCRSPLLSTLMFFYNKNAQFSNRYFNSQLSALWENALDCYTQNEPGSTSNETSKHTRALAQYYYHAVQIEDKPNVAIYPFYAEFDKPKIERICQDASLLTLTIKKGYVDLDQRTTWITNAGRKKSLADIRAIFLIKSSSTTFNLEESVPNSTGPIPSSTPSDPDPQRNSGHLRAMVLDVTSANLVTLRHGDKELLILETVGAAVKFYLEQYLQFLKTTFNNILFDLPHFGATSYEPKIEYVAARHKPMRDYPLYHYPSDGNITIINRWFITNWTEVKGKYGQFEIEFGTPQVEPLYKSTVVLTINMPSITFTPSDSTDRKDNIIIKGCEMSFIVEAVVGDFNVTFDLEPTSTCHTAYFPPSEVAPQDFQRLIDVVNGTRVKNLLESQSPSPDVMPRDPEPRSLLDSPFSGFPLSILDSHFKSVLPRSWRKGDFSAQSFSSSIQSPQDYVAPKVHIVITAETCRYLAHGSDSEAKKLDNVHATIELSLVVKDHEDLSDSEQNRHRECLANAEYRHLQVKFDKNKHSCSLVTSSNISGDEQEILQRYILEYLETHLQEENQTFRTFTPSAASRRIPDKIYHFGESALILVFMGIQGSYRDPSSEKIPTAPRPDPGQSFIQAICLRVRDLLKPSCAYINASTTLIPSTLVKGEYQSQIDFVTWRDINGTELKMDDLNWQYSSDSLSLKGGSSRVRGEGRKPKLSLSSTTNNKISVNFDRQGSVLFNVLYEGESVVNLSQTEGWLRQVSWSQKSSAKWSTPVSIGLDLTVTQTQQTNINWSDVPSGRMHGPVEFKVSETHRRVVDRFTQFQIGEIQESLNNIVNGFCNLAGAENSEAGRKYSSEKDKLIVYFYTPVR